MKSLEDAIIIACKAHSGQRDKANKPYILHPLRVMLKMETVEEMMVAVLHDVVEDTDVTIDDLREMDFPPDVIYAVDLLTHKEGDEYFEYIRSCKINPIARKVKEADANDNMDLSRINEPDERDFSRREKYSSVIHIMRQNKNFYESDQYQKIPNDQKLLTEELLKTLESEGIRYIIEFIEDGYIINMAENSEHNLLVVRLINDCLRVKISGVSDVNFELNSENINNNKHMSQFRKKLSRRYESLLQMISSN